MKRLLKKIFQKKKSEDNQSYKLIYEMFYSHVYKTAFFITKDPYLAQDVLQETFIKVFNNINKLDDGDKMKAWISTITTRTAIDFIRKKKRGNEFDLDNVDNNKDIINDLHITVEDVVDKNFTIRLIREEIAHLSPDHRNVLYLKYVVDLSNQEIAAHLELNEGTVKTRIHRAKQQLKKKLQKKLFVDGDIS